MNEIEKTRDDEKITNKEKISHLDVSLEIRNKFQGAVLNLLIAEKMLVENDTEETSRYAESISDFIDNPDNVQVQELIKHNKLEEAVELMVDEIHRKESLPKAA